MSGGTGHQQVGNVSMNVMKDFPIKRINFLQKIGIFLAIPVLVISLLPLPAHAQAATCDKEFYSTNDIVFYDPCSDSCSASAGSGSLTGPAPSALQGTTNEEKVWNYFIARGLTPVGAAGAMGNMQQESSQFDPWAGEHGSTGNLDKGKLNTGFGLIQWTNTGGSSQGRRYGVMQYLEDNGVPLNASDPSQLDNALLFELNYLWDGEYKSLTWQEQVNAEQTVEGNPEIEYSVDNTGNGSAMVFHKLVERSGDGATGKQERIDSAKAFLTQFGEGAASGSPGSCSGVGAGGLTFDQATELAKKIVDNWDANFCSGVIDTSGDPGGYCTWTEGYCTAGAAWMAITTAPDPSRITGIPNGYKVADQLIAGNSDVYTAVNPDGSNIQPFSIWSFGDGGPQGSPGHTGTIVGVGTDGSIVTLEVNWGGDAPGATKNFSYNPGHKVAVYEFTSFEAFKASHNGYVFTNMATPKDSSIALEMGKKIAAYMGN